MEQRTRKTHTITCLVDWKEAGAYSIYIRIALAVYCLLYLLDTMIRMSHFLFQ